MSTYSYGKELLNLILFLILTFHFRCLGFAKTMADFNQFLDDDPEYKELIDTYIGSIVTASLPIETIHVPCPHCAKKNLTSEVKPVRVLSKHRSKGIYKSKNAPHLVKCSNSDCSYSASSKDWLEYCISYAESKLKSANVEGRFIFHFFSNASC
jgi:hypothetical protein